MSAAPEMDFAEGDAEDKPKRTILVVDDKEMNRDLLARRLYKAGYNVISLEDGVRTLEYLKSASCDLIILDLMMPVIDGLETLREIRKSHSIEELPVILATARDDDKPMKEALEAGANDYVQKPFEFEVLLARVKNQISRKRYMEEIQQIRMNLTELVAERSKELAQAHSLMRSIMENVPVGLFECNLAGKINFANPSFYRILGAAASPKPESLDASGLMNLPVFRDLFDGIIKNNAPQNSQPAETPHPILAKTLRFALTPRMQEDTLTGIVGVIADVTEQKNLEMQVLQNSKLATMGQMASGVAHDFNNLLTVILGHVGILESGDISAALQESLQQIKGAGERAANLTRQLLLISRKQNMQMRNIDLNAAIADTVRMLTRLLGEDIQLDFHPAKDSLFVMADAGMLDQVLMNLAVNARDAMPKGGRLMIETSRREFNAETAPVSAQIRSGVFALLSVTDTGSGIPPEILLRIFEPFFTTKDVGKGTGLGLATVFGIVQQHKGWIEADSEVGKGSVFRVYLPAASDTSGNSDTTAQTAAVKGGGETILLVEDETPIREMLSKYLALLGYVVFQADTGAGALAIFREHGKKIHLVISDLVMPGGMNGAELAEQLTKIHPGIKVIYSSGYSDVRVMEGLALEEGVNFIPKPYSLKKLTDILRFQLDKK